MAPHRNSVWSRGVGLLELTIVISIVALVSALFFGHAQSGLGSSGLAAQVEEVHSIFAAARVHAVKTNTNACVVLTRAPDSSHPDNPCTTVVEYHYSLDRTHDVGCQPGNSGGGNSRRGQVQKLRFLDLAYSMDSGPSRAHGQSCPLGVQDSFQFLAGSGFLKRNGNSHASTLISFYNPQNTHAGRWQFRVEQSGVLILTGD
ncbi:MAG TPA: hypothetical protein VFV43_11480 [Limnobacter sp.]|nr:hypothetical protein [Limnobacter sp.]